MRWKQFYYSTGEKGKQLFFQTFVSSFAIQRSNLQSTSYIVDGRIVLHMQSQ